jgi:hypothetical protein
MITDQLLAEIEAGQGESLTRAARRIQPTRQDKPTTMSCLLRWILTGVRGPSGERIRLEAARLAGKWITTPGAIRRFVEAQTPLDAEGVPAQRSPSRRQQASKRAAHELEKAGI